ncbi:MAG: glycosyltransferase family 4 protein [Patescibacteria group bacterium]
MNIAIFTHNYPKDKDDRKDAGVFIYDFVQELKKKHKVFVFCPDYGNDKKFGNWSLYNPINIFKFFKSISYGIKESSKFVNKNKIDYVLCAWAIPSGIYAFFSKIKHNIPYGIWYLGSDINIYSKIPVISSVISLVSKQADNLFANSYALTEIANLKYGKCEMLPASTKVDIGKNNETQIEKIDKNKINILYVGRLEKVKGPDLLVEACRKLNNNYMIRVVGDGTMRHQLESSIDNSKIHFLGYLGLTDIVEYMKKSDFLIIPSRNESLPLVILEAANYKLPVLASNVGDCKYVLNKYMIGETFKSSDIDDIVNRTKQFNYKKIKSGGQFAKLVVDYSLRSSVKRFLNSII